MTALVIRSGHPHEARTAALLLARQHGCLPAFIEGEPPAGLAPWLWLRGVMPVLCSELAPGEVRRLPTLPGYKGPLLIASGIDGSFEREGVAVGDWRVPLPLPLERVACWTTHVDQASAERLGRAHRLAKYESEPGPRIGPLGFIAHAADKRRRLGLRLLAKRGVFFGELRLVFFDGRIERSDIKRRVVGSGVYRYFFSISSCSAFVGNATGRLR